MDKTKYILLTIVISMALIGTAYAAWIQDIEVSTITATGELRAVVSQPLIFSNHISSTQMVAVNPPIINQSGEHLEHIQMELGNYYPGVESTFTFEVTNEGTIPFDIEIADVTNGLPWGVNYLLQATSGIYSEENGFMQLPAGPMGWIGSREIGPLEGNGIEMRMLGHETMVVEPGERYLLVFKLVFEEDLVEHETEFENALTLEENGTYVLEFSFDISQFNVD